MFDISVIKFNKDLYNLYNGMLVTIRTSVDLL